MATKTITMPLWQAYKGNIELVQHESSGRTLFFNLIDSSGAAIDLTGCAVVFNMTKGTNVIYNACTVVSATAGKMSVLVTSGFCDTAGEFDAFIEIATATPTVQRTQDFTITVKDSADNTGAVEATSEFTALTVAVALVSGHEARITAAESDIGMAQSDIAALEAERTGWIPITGAVTFGSVDDPTGVISIVGDYSALKKHTRLKLSNGGNVIYAKLTKDSTYSDPSTTVTFLHEIDPSDSLALHLMIDDDITDVYYSMQYVPQGFPLSPAKWTVKYTSTTLSTKTSPASGTWYYTDIGSHHLVVPIGDCTLSYQFKVRGSVSVAGNIEIECGLSTSSSGPSDRKYVSAFEYYSALIRTADIARGVFDISQEEKATWYVIARITGSNLSSLQLANGDVTLVISAAFGS